MLYLLSWSSFSFYFLTASIFWLSFYLPRECAVRRLLFSLYLSLSLGNSFSLQGISILYFTKRGFFCTSFYQVQINTKQRKRSLKNPNSTMQRKDFPGTLLLIPLFVVVYIQESKILLPAARAGWRAPWTSKKRFLPDKSSMISCDWKASPKTNDNIPKSWYLKERKTIKRCPKYKYKTISLFPKPPFPKCYSLRWA